MKTSKQKGNRGEREIAQFLSKITGEPWFRVPSSGAIATSGGDKELKGDVYCRDSRYCDIVIEVKNHTGAVTVNDLCNEKSQFNAWLDQLDKECPGPEGYLFFKSNRRWFFIIRRREEYTNPLSPYSPLEPSLPPLLAEHLHPFIVPPCDFTGSLHMLKRFSHV